MIQPDSRSADLSPPAPRPAERAVVILAMLAMSGLLFVGELASDPRPSTAALVADAGVAFVACLALPWLLVRVESAVVVLVVLSALIPTATPLAASAVLLLARQRRLRIAVVAALGGVAAQLVRGAWRPLEGVSFGWWTIVVVAGYAAVVGWGAWMQAHRALIESLEERARRAEDEQASRVEQARRAERTRIAREMHDVLAHRLSVLATVAGAVEYHPDAPPAELARAADVIRSTAHLALEDLREIVGVLRADPLGDRTSPGSGLDRPQPTLSELPALFEEWRRTGVVIAVDNALAVEDRGDVSAGLGRTVYRVIQEALTNAVKHAPGEAVRITLRGRPGDSLTVTVVNRMPSGDDESVVPGSGVGLVGLAERVNLAGGSFEAGPTAAHEHRVCASLPWPA